MYCHILQFLRQMFNVSALLLDDALLKCVIIEVVLFSIVVFKTLTVKKVLKLVRYFDEVIRRTKMYQFLGHPVFHTRQTPEFTIK